MTPQASRLTDTVESMLLDAGQEQDTELRAALLSLGSLASLPAPSPNAQLAALLASRPDELTRRRRQRRHRNRSAIVGLAVVAGMGLGVTGVAATGSGAGGEDQPLSAAPAGRLGALVERVRAARCRPCHRNRPGTRTGGIRCRAGRRHGGRSAAVRASSKCRTSQRGARRHRGRTAKEGPDDGGADAQAGSGSPGTSGGVKNSKEQGKLPESSPSQEAEQAPEPVRQTLEKTEKLLAGVVPGNAASKEAGNGSGKSGTNKKADPGAKWLKKFSR